MAGGRPKGIDAVGVERYGGGDGDESLGRVAGEGGVSVDGEEGGVGDGGVGAGRAGCIHGLEERGLVQAHQCQGQPKEGVRGRQGQRDALAMLGEVCRGGRPFRRGGGGGRWLLATAFVHVVTHSGRRVEQAAPHYGRWCQNQIPYGEERTERQRVHEDVEEPFARAERQRLAHSAVRCLKQLGRLLLEEAGERGQLDLETAQRRRLRVKVGRQPMHQRHEEGERIGLIMVAHKQGHRCGEIHRLRVAPVGSQHAPCPK